MKSDIPRLIDAVCTLSTERFRFAFTLASIFDRPHRGDMSGLSVPPTVHSDEVEITKIILIYDYQLQMTHDGLLELVNDLPVYQESVDPLKTSRVEWAFVSNEERERSEECH